MKSAFSEVDLVEADQVAEVASTIVVAEEWVVVVVVRPNEEDRQALMDPARDHVSISRPLNHLMVMPLNRPGIPKNFMILSLTGFFFYHKCDRTVEEI